MSSGSLGHNPCAPRIIRKDKADMRQKTTKLLCHCMCNATAGGRGHQGSIDLGINWTVECGPTSIEVMPNSREHPKLAQIRQNKCPVWAEFVRNRSALAKSWQQVVEFGPKSRHTLVKVGPSLAKLAPNSPNPATQMFRLKNIRPKFPKRLTEASPSLPEFGLNLVENTQISTMSANACPTSGRNRAACGHNRPCAAESGPH